MNSINCHFILSQKYTISVLIGHQRNDGIMNMQMKKKCQWFVDNGREEQANSSVSWKIQSKESIAQDSMLKKCCRVQLVDNLLWMLELNSMQCKKSNQWWDGFIQIVSLPYLFFLINLVLSFQEYVFSLHIMCGYQCDEAVTKKFNVPREVIWYHFTAVKWYHITSHRKGR